MKEYYYHDGHEQKGPVSLEDLLKSDIKSDTMIWHAGLENWTQAKDVEELKLIFQQKTPPPFERVSPPQEQISTTSMNAGYAQPLPLKRKSGISRIMLWVLLAGILFLVYLVYINNVSRSSGATDRLTYSESKMSVGDYERTHPSEFLQAAGTYNETFLGNKIRIQGQVINKATVTNFKDMVIQVSYFSNTKTLINTERFVLYEYLPAHSSKSFNWKIKPPGGTETIGWDVVNATPY